MISLCVCLYLFDVHSASDRHLMCSGCVWKGYSRDSVCIHTLVDHLPKLVEGERRVIVSECVCAS